MKAIIVEDSRLARQELKHLLNEHEQVQVIGEAGNVPEARELIESLKPDLIFLDIQMPGENGFDLLESLEYMPEVIFTTAYNEYAIRAFEHNALDYLLKPVRPDRLAAALSKVPEKILQANPGKQLLGLEDKVFVKDGEQCWFVQLADIRLFEIENNYTRIYFGNYTPMIPRTLQYLESRLDERDFFRASRKHIVNVKWIERVEPWFSGTLKLRLKGGQEVEVSRRQTSRFKELMSF